MQFIFKTLLSSALFLSESFATAATTDKIEDAIVIVGSHRKPGWVKPDIGEIVGQGTANFTHTNSFPRQRVVSVDVGSCDLKGFEHVQGDFRTTKSFAPNSQETVMFEWFPSCNSEDCNDNLMLTVLEKAFNILKSGGTLLIDSHPYFSSGDSEDAILQELNPFSLFLTYQEIERIKVCLSIISTGQILPQPYEVIAEALSEAVKIVSTIFNEKQEVIAISIHKSMSNKTPDRALLAMFDSAMGYMFLWAYHSLSRAEIMMTSLSRIGFAAEAAKIEFLLENPFNHRKYAWLIQVKKPMTASSDSGGGGADVSAD